jgi:spermidine synthase
LPSVPRIEIPVVIFVAGAGLLALELLASRYMTPAFGSSIYIWGAILSTTLLCLAMGYRWGGRLADRLSNPYDRLILKIVLAAAWIGLIPVLGRGILTAGMALDPAAGPLFVMTVIFCAPITLLSTVTPLAFGALVRTASERPGRALGDLFALSTAGSVLGALATAYLVVPALGVNRAFLVTSLVLFLVSLPALFRGTFLRTGIALLGTLALVRQFPDTVGGASRLQDGVSYVHRRASAYGQLDVLDDHRDGSRILLLDGASQNWVEGANWSKSLFAYIPSILRTVGRYQRVGHRALVLGLGAGTLARSLEHLHYDVEVVELDAAVLEIAEEYFDFSRDRFQVHVGDARWLTEQRAGAGYALLVLDVAGGGNHPSHLYTREALQAMQKAMAANGLLVVNLVVRLDEPHDRAVRHILSTVASVFPHVEAFDITPYRDRDDLANVLVYASDRPPIHDPPSFVTDVRLPVRASLRPLTDDWNPIDLWSISANDRWHRNIRNWLGVGALIPG